MVNELMVEINDGKQTLHINQINLSNANIQKKVQINEKKIVYLYKIYHLPQFSRKKNETKKTCDIHRTFFIKCKLDFF
jgi:hypothetical protein